jgi:hypothetical protein
LHLTAPDGVARVQEPERLAAELHRPRALPKLLNDASRKAVGRVMQAMLGMSKSDIAGLKQAYEGQPAA